MTRSARRAFLLVLLTSAWTQAGGINRLQLAIAGAKVEDTRRLLEAGADPNARDSAGQPIVRWLGSGQRLSDDALLEVAKLLELHHCTFEDGSAQPGLLLNLAPRRLPKTLAFIASKRGPGELTRALEAMARSDDLDSINVLLDAGADPLASGRGSALAEAARAGRTPAVTAMLKHVADKGSAPVLVAYDGALRLGHADTARAFVEAGMKPPPVVEAVRPACEAKALTLAQVQLLSSLGLPNANKLAGLAGGLGCKQLARCGDLVLVDCNSAADGPAYYLDQEASKLLATCGGACMGGCKNCPPVEWTCSCAR
jgi:ankyrin repeat protein